MMAPGGIQLTGDRVWLVLVGFELLEDVGGGVQRAGPAVGHGDTTLEHSPVNGRWTVQWMACSERDLPRDRPMQRGHP